MAAGKVMPKTVPLSPQMDVEEDIGRLLAATQHTLSEMLALLHQVLVANQSLLEQASQECLEPKGQ
jgi:hypothetical protein